MFHPCGAKRLPLWARNRERPFQDATGAPNEHGRVASSQKGRPHTIIVLIHLPLTSMPLLLLLVCHIVWRRARDANILLHNPLGRRQLYTKGYIRVNCVRLSFFIREGIACGFSQWYQAYDDDAAVLAIYRSFRSYPCLPVLRGNVVTHLRNPNLGQTAKDMTSTIPFSLMFIDDLHIYQYQEKGYQIPIPIAKWKREPGVDIRLIAYT